MSADSTSAVKHIEIRGSRPGLADQLRRVYPDVWQSICGLAPGKSLLVDLERDCILQFGYAGWGPVIDSIAAGDLLAVLKVIDGLPYRDVSSADGGLAVVILAGGTGTRFADGVGQKVLHPVLGVPALQRSLQTSREAGAKTIVVVLGYCWQEVFEFVQEHGPGCCHYVYQPQPLGTGDAARRATWLLRDRGFQGTVLILAGDKVLLPGALPTMLATHHKYRSDMTLAVADKRVWPDSGRVVLDEHGYVLAIIERPDVIQRRIFRCIYHLDGETVDTRGLLRQFRLMQPNERKLLKALGPRLWGLLSSSSSCRRRDLTACIERTQLTFRIPCPDGAHFELTPEEVEERCDLVNVSLYIFSTEALYWAMDRLESTNAQGEFYLTDAAHILAQADQAPRRFRVCAARMQDDYDAAGFNTIEELHAIEDHMRSLGLS